MLGVSSYTFHHLPKEGIMKKLFAIAVVLSALFLGGCVGIPSAHMSGSIGVGPQGVYNQQGVPVQQNGGAIHQPVFNSQGQYMGSRSIPTGPPPAYLFHNGVRVIW